MRVVEVWLDDEFKEYFYTREPMIRGYPIGNISKQVEFRRKHCPHSFKWFMDNVAYEVYDRFPPLPPNVGWGEVIPFHRVVHRVMITMSPEVEYDVHRTVQLFRSTYMYIHEQVELDVNIFSTP